MAIVKVDKWDACKALINTWIEDQTLYCNNCGMDANPALLWHESCCENPQIARNVDHLKGCIEQNKQRRQMQKNEFGSNDTHTWRSAVSMPPRLYYMLKKYFSDHDEKLFNDDKELIEFMKKFPALTICEKA